MGEIGLGDVDIEARPVERYSGVADGVDVADRCVEGIAFLHRWRGVGRRGGF